MPDTSAPFSLESFETLGQLLKFLRRRARISQRDLAIAVGYSESQISRLESNRRPPDLTTLAARFAPALGIDDEPETLARLLALAAAARGEPPPRASAPTAAPPGPAHEPAGPAPRAAYHPGPAPRHNLPLQLTNFIGRGPQLAEVERLLRANRLLTLVGPGGTGKTRLALQVAAAMLDEFPDGAWLVDLAPTTQPFQVPQAVAQALGLRAESAELAEPTPPLDHPVRDALALSLDHLRDKNLLLILDNCEHQVEACAQLAEQLLRAATGLRILATSREALAIAGEMSYPVPALSLPDPGQLPALEAVAQTEAVRLFVERAQAVRPDFALTAENVQTVVQICQRLDGIPLALELAAARARALTVEQIAAHLDDRFRLLTGGSRSAPQRQQTLRGAIDWSYDLLSAAEQSGLRRLAVFAGGWTLEAAEAVCGDKDEGALRGLKDEMMLAAPILPSAFSLHTQRSDVLDLLTQLVAKSLVLSEQQPGMGARFSLLETIRQYAYEKLIEAGESESAHDRHLDYYLALAEEAAPALRGSGQAQWVNRLRRENDNFRAAQAWAIQTENAPAALRLSGALAYFWRIRGYAAEGRRRLEAALQLRAALQLQASQGALPASAALARVLLEAGRIDMEKDPATSQAQLEQARDIYQSLDDPSGAANALYWLAEQRVMAHKSYAPALPLYQQARDLWAAAGDEWGMGVADHRLGHAAEEARQRTQARELYERSVQILGQVGDGWQLLGPRRDLARLAWADGDLARAREMFEKNLAAYDELGSRSGMVDALSNLAALSMAQGDYAQAGAEAQAMQTLPASQRNIAAGRMRQGQIDYLQDRPELAQAHFETSLKIFRELNDQNGMGWVPPWLGRVAYRAADFDRARALIDAGLAIDDPDGYWPELAFALLSRGDVDRAQNDAAGAARYYARSLRIVIDHYHQPDVAGRLEGFAKLAAAQQPQRAARLFGAAEALRARMGTPLAAVERASYDSALMQTIGQIDPPAFDAAWAEGQAFTWEQAAAYALEG